MAGVIPLGPDTVWTGFQMSSVAPNAVNMFGSTAPLTQLGPTGQQTIPPNVSGSIGANQSLGSMGGGAPSVGQAQALASAANPLSSHSPVIWIVAGILVSVLGLHFIFWPKEKVI